MTDRMPLQHCPTCEAPLDAATHAGQEGPVPRAGDVTICLYCQTPLRFAEGLRLVALDIDELEREDAAVAAQVRRLIKLTRRFKRQMQAKGEWPDRGLL
jgi:hypothetical protein